MEQVQFWGQIAHPLCCPLPGPFLACKRCWMAPRDWGRRCWAQLKLQPNTDLKKGETENWFNQHSTLGCSKKHQAWERLPTNKLNFGLLKHFPSRAQDPKRISPWPARSRTQWDFCSPAPQASPTPRKTEFSPVCGCFAEFLPSPLEILRDAFPDPSCTRFLTHGFQPNCLKFQPGQAGLEL